MNPQKPITSLRNVYIIGNGPSSSHTIAPSRAARIFSARHPECHRFRITLCGSLAATGLGHLTHEAIAHALAPAQCIFLQKPDQIMRHTNAMCFEALDENENPSATWWAYSIGGGVLEDDNGPLDQGLPAKYPVANISQALHWCKQNHKPFWALADTTEPDIRDHLAQVWDTMRNTVRNGLHSDQCVLPGGLNVPRKAEATYARAQSLTGALRDLSLLAAYALAVSEENAAAGIVVTAPTCGAAGILPAVLHYFAAQRNTTTQQTLRALATAGIFGASVQANASVSGAEVGCQGEIGTACAMAAAAATQLLGGSPPQIEYAAEMAMEHHLGLTCDPIAGLVQIPCIERNAIGAMRALECASLALLSDGTHIISFDEAVAVMAETGRDLQSAYKETACGGLAEIWRRRSSRITAANPRPPPIDE